MTTRKALSFVLVWVAIASATPGWSASYTVKPGKVGRFEIEYTMGTHEGDVSGLAGQITLNTKKIALTGKLMLPISGLVTSSEEMNCHLQESLGLMYEGSDFPDDHVCDDEDQLPKQGPNSVRFPSIEFSIISAKLVTGNCATQCELNVQGSWRIHGIDQVKTETVRLQKTPEGFQAKVRTTLLLSDHKVVVKKFLFIGVEDEAQVNLEFDLVQKD